MISEERSGDMLGPWLLRELLGEGSMGRVWFAQHTKLGRKAAIKVLRPEHTGNSVVINRFFDEARAVNRINHEHIVEIADFVEEKDPPRVYCVMEYLEGRSLAQMMDEAPLPVQSIVHVLKQLCDALGAAHEQGIVHRDVKPDNIILVRRPGAPLFVKVLDFGVAKLGADLRRQSVSRTVQGTLLGTPLFMAPEQIVGQEVDARADIYAVGCLLYWMLAGRLPFNSPHFGELSMQVIKDAPPPLPSRTPGGERIPAGLADLAMRCLAKKAEERPHSMEAVLDALERPHQARLFTRRRRSMGLLGAVAALLVGAVAWSFDRELPTARLPAAATAAAVKPAASKVTKTIEAKVERKAVPFDAEGTIDPFAP
jgi:eukaryotic-like serine/threonine-protein kinase